MAIRWAAPAVALTLAASALTAAAPPAVAATCASLIKPKLFPQTVVTSAKDISADAAKSASSFSCK